MNVSKSVRGFYKFNKTGPHTIACVAYGKVATVGESTSLPAPRASSPGPARCSGRRLARWRAT
jgi:hypothetical protein